MTSFSAIVRPSVDVAAQMGKESTMAERFNFHTPDGEYVTTERAATRDEALAQAQEKYPGVDLRDPPGKPAKARFSPGANGRHNFFVKNEDGSIDYLTTTRADNVEAALAAAQLAYPNVEVLKYSDLPG